MTEPGSRETESQLAHFEALYRAQDEPWSFSTRAVETLRHRRVAALVRSLEARRVLDLGCSLGQLTARLASLRADVVGMDLSPTAVRRARERLANATGVPMPSFATGSATGMPFAPASFDAIVASDGLYSWQLEADARAATLREIHDALTPGGHAILTEHMRPVRFPEFIAEVRASPLRVVEVTYLYDRPWYQFESWLKAVRHTSGARALRRSDTIARALCGVGRAFGPAGSRHIIVVATKP